jgi:hypothetical protein
LPRRGRLQSKNDILGYAIHQHFTDSAIHEFVASDAGREHVDTLCEAIELKVPSGADWANRLSEPQIA